MAFEAANLLFALWSVLGLVFLALEYWRMDGNFFSFGIGAIGGVVAWVLGYGFPLQAAAFAVVSLLSFLLLRPPFRKRLLKSESSHAEGLDLLVGLEGTVIAKIAGTARPGRVEVRGRAAKAVPVDPQQQYNVGDRIVVTAVDDDALVVKKMKR